jgi:hypothetical protein
VAGKSGEDEMTDLKNCLPDGAQRHFIDLRNIRLETESARYQTRLRDLRAQRAAKGQGRSGWQEMEEWKYKEDFSNNLATGYLQDTFETCKLYDIPLTRQLCDCLIGAVEDLLLSHYKNALTIHAQGVSDIKVPLVVRQQMAGDLSAKRFKIMPQIRVMIETARVEDEKRWAAIVGEKQNTGDIYNQNITQHGGVMNASLTGNIIAQQIAVSEFESLQPALAAMRTFFKNQEDSLDADESIGLLASAERAASEKDEGKMLACLKQIPAKAWDVGKTVIPQVLLHYLKLNGLA